MTKNMGHERCSELLRAYARRELDESDALAVEEHLGSCDACRSELAGLNALLAADSVELDLRERRKLHEAVARAVEPRDPVIIGAGFEKRRGWMQRFAPTLSAAALLLVVLVVAMSGITGGGDDESASTGAEGEAGAPLREQQDGSKDKATFEDADKAAPETTQALGPEANKLRRHEGADTAETSGSALARSPRPTFTERYVTNLRAAASQDVLQEFAGSYTVADAEKREGRYISLLSLEAPPEVRDQVEACSSVVRTASEEPVLAAGGALGRVDDTPGLFLSFVYTRAERGPLSSYMVWAWPRGSCSTRLGYRTGPVSD